MVCAGLAVGVANGGLFAVAAALPFRTVFALGIHHCLPPHVARRINATTGERNDVIDDVAGAAAGEAPIRRARIRTLKGLAGRGGPRLAFRRGPLQSRLRPWL